MSTEVESAAVVPEEMVRLTLVPVEVFTGLCDHKDCRNPDHLGYGLSDAVSAWSDCNRAVGHIYRVDDLPMRDCEAGETVEIWVRAVDAPFFEKQWGTP